MPRRSTVLRSLAYSLVSLALTAGFAHAGAVTSAILVSQAPPPDPFHDAVSGVGLLPSINNSGVVAYTVSYYNSHGGQGSIGEIATTSGQQIFRDEYPNQFIRLSSNPVINDNGTLAFQADISNSIRGLFTAPANGTPALVAQSGTATGDVGNFGTSGGLAPALNNSDTITMMGLRNGLSSAQGSYAIVVGHATSPLSATYALTSGNPGQFFSMGDSVISNSGTIAFTGQTNAGVQGVYTLAPNATTATALVTNQGQNSFLGLGNALAINNSGSIAFTGFSSKDNSRGVFVTDSTGHTSTIVDFGVSNNIYPVQVAPHVALSNAGEVAFQAAIGNGVGTGVFVSNGSGGITKIAQTGDTLAGMTVQSVSLSNYSVNDIGQVAFAATLNAGNNQTRTGIFIYNPDGATASNAIQPVSTSGSTFNFAPIVLPTGPIGLGRSAPIYIDPIVATGYDFMVTGGELFNSVLLPTGLGTTKYELDLWNGSAYVFSQYINAGTTFTFNSPVDRFQIEGIPIGAGLDPNDPNAFVTGLTFSGTGAADVTMTSIAFNTSTPEPASIVACLVGVGTAIGVRMRRKS